MVSGFSACSGCGRHVRLSDSACPFCGAALAAASRGGRVIREIVGARASRAALFAGAVLVAGCGGGDDDGDGDGGASKSAEAGIDGSVGQPVYGAPVGTDGGVVKDEAGVPIAQPVYGAPVHEDGG